MHNYIANMLYFYVVGTISYDCRNIWLFAEFQYMCVALMFTIEKKFKQPIYTNCMLLSPYYFCGYNCWIIFRGIYGMVDRNQCYLHIVIMENTGSNVCFPSSIVHSLFLAY